MLFAPAALAQTTPVAPARPPLPIIILDSVTRLPVPGASVGVPGTRFGGATDPAGRLRLGAPAGTVVRIQALGYAPRAVRMPTADTPLTLLLAPAADAELETVVVTATRTNSRLEDQPTAVEVLGEDDMIEENGIKPGSITSILGDIAGTQIQPTSPVTGNADLRIQGLPGRYSQVLRDGLPLLGGFAGGFGLLQIPPLDLRQIELIKGAASTLYGGGAIAGLVNLVSKEPVADHPDLGVTLNQTTLRETNLNVFGSRRAGRVGFTAFGGVTRQQAVDVDGDGFADVPDVQLLTVHPRVFLYGSARRPESKLALGYTGTFENRAAGDLHAVRADFGTQPNYRVDNRTVRHAADLIYTRPDSGGVLTVKALVSDFGRRVRTTTGVDFTARQLSTYAEVSTLRHWGRHSPVFGVNLTGEAVRPDAASPTPLQARYAYYTPGVFVQDDWQPLGGPLTVQMGVRLDHHSRYGWFALPRLAAIYHFTPDLTARVTGGLGYRAPVPYTNDIDERIYPLVAPIAASVAAERAAAVSGDFTWNHRFSPEAVLVLSQGAFLTRLTHPLTFGQSLLASAGGAGPGVAEAWQNAPGAVRTRGLESYARLRFHETELYIGYVLTDARRQYAAPSAYIELLARHKFSGVAVQELGKHFGIGIEASTIGRQYLTDGTPTPAYLLAAAMLRYRTGPFTVVLNGENLFDYRQTRRERVVVTDVTNPTFLPLWAPVEGRVINLSVNWRLPE